MCFFCVKAKSKSGHSAYKEIRLAKNCMASFDNRKKYDIELDGVGDDLLVDVADVDLELVVEDLLA